MFAIDHAATALLVKRRYPPVPMAPLLVSVQAMELVWVGLNYIGVERTTTEAAVRSVADIHLAYMPYSHSVGTAVGAAVLAWLIIEKGFARAALGRAIGLGIVSHLVLDLATHAHDIVLWPGWATPKFGLGLYDAAPLGAFVVEFVYGIVCWYVYRGGPGLLALISLGNLANLSFFSPAIPGPEQYLAGRPMLVVTVIFVQIVATLVLVGVLARRRTVTSTVTWRSGRRIGSSTAACAALMFFASTAPPEAHEVSMTSEQNPAIAAQTTRLIIDRFNEAFNRHDADALAPLLTDDTVFEDTSPAPDGRRIEGKAAVVAFWREWFTRNTDAVFEAEDVIVSGDRAVVRWVYRKQRNGQPWHIRGVDVFTVRDGKVAAKLAYVKG
jgi:ketosteroid isomerase-like protein